MQRKAVLLVALFLGAASIQSADLVWRNPSYGPFLWREISVTPNAFYLPSQGVILKSTNARDWNIHYQPTSAGLYSVAQSPDKLLAVGGNWDHPQANPGYPTFYISTNGVDFKFLKDAPGHVHQIVYGKGYFVASAFEMFRSANGLDWQRITQVPSVTDFYLIGDLMFANGHFLRATSGGVYISEDAITWTQTGPSGHKLSYHNGTYAVAGNNSVSYSEDGRNWRTHSASLPTSFRTFAIGARGTFAVGDSLNKEAAEAIFSADGTNWITFNLPFSSRPWDVKFINGEYVMVGDTGMVAYSSDGTNWTNNSSITSIHIWATAKGGDRLIGVGSHNTQGIGVAVSSTNGLTWEGLNLPAVDELNAAAYLNGTFVAAGSGASLVVSTNAAANWIRVTPAIPVSTTNPTGMDFTAITTSPRGFVGVGRGWYMIVSTNGLDWEALRAPAFAVYDIAYGNGLYVGIVSGDEGGAATSTDLINWTFLPKPFRAANNVEFGNGRFALAPYPCVSTDGTNWTQASGLYLTSINYSEGVFSATGGLLSQSWGGFSKLGDPRRGYVSVDGLNWHQIFETPAIHIKAARYFGRFMGFGSYAGILEVDNFGILDISRNTDGSLNLQPLHPAKFTSEIERSSDLFNWSVLPQGIPSSSGPGEFYRLKLGNAGFQ